MNKSISAAIMVVITLVFTGCGSDDSNVEASQQIEQMYEMRQYNGDVKLSEKVTEKDVLIFDFADDARGIRLMLDNRGFQEFLDQSDAVESDVQEDADGRFVDIGDYTMRQVASETVISGIDEVYDTAPNMTLIFAVGEYKTGAA